MKKYFTLLIVMFLAVSVLFIGIGCKATAAETTAAAKTTAAETTAAIDPKTVTFEYVRQLRIDMKPVPLAKGHTLGYASGDAANPYMIAVDGNMFEVWEFFGGSKDDVVYLDNKLDSATAAANADIIFSKKVECYVQAMVDQKLNAVIGKKAKDLGVPMIAMDHPVEGWPICTADYPKIGKDNGQYVADNIDKKFGSVDNIDVFVYCIDPNAGELVNMRSLGALDALVPKYGKEIVDPETEGSKGITIPTGSTAELGMKAMSALLVSKPKAKNWVIFCQNEGSMTGVVSAIETAGRWNPDNYMIMDVGGWEQDQNYIRNGYVSGAGCFFANKYGEIIIPAAIAFIYGNRPPEVMYYDTVVLTKDNIDQYYPVK